MVEEFAYVKDRTGPLFGTVLFLMNNNQNFFNDFRVPIRGIYCLMRTVPFSVKVTEELAFRRKSHIGSLMSETCEICHRAEAHMGRRMQIA